MQVTEAHIVAARTRAATVSRQLGGNADSLLARVISGYRPPEPSATDVRHAPQAATWEALLHAPAIDALQPAAELHPTYDLSAYLAHRSERAYDGESAIKTEIEQQGGAHFQRFAHWPDAAFVYLCGRTAVVAFRGTVPRNVPQWFYTDLFALPLIGTPARHIGFDLAWRRLRPDITTWLASHLPTDGDIVLTGHSLGAALALIAGHDLAVRGYRIRGIVTLGTPRVGFEAFQNAFLSTECYPAGSGASARTLSAVTRRLTHADDLVSRMPPPPFFRHVGEGLVISGDGHLNTDESRTTIERIFSWFDGAVGSVYERIDKARTPTAHPRGVHVMTPADHALAARVTPINPLAGGTVFSALPQTPSDRLVNDALSAQKRFPFASFIPPPVAYWGLMCLGVILSAIVFGLGAFDLLSSHSSKRYVGAFRARYLAKARRLGTE